MTIINCPDHGSVNHLCECEVNKIKDNTRRVAEAMSKPYTTTKEQFTKLVTKIESEPDDHYGEHNKYELPVVIQCLVNGCEFYRRLEKPLINDILIEDRLRKQLERLLEVQNKRRTHT